MSNKKKTSILILLVILLLPSLAFAATPPLVTTVVTNLVDTAWNIGAGVVVVFWILTGILFLTAQGAPEKLTTAKKALLYAVIGTLVVVVAFSAIALVKNASGL